MPPSLRKRKVPEKTGDTALNLDNTVPKRKRESTPKNKRSSFASLSTPSTSGEKGRTCAFYRTSTDEDGKPIFNKKLLRYFMTVDSPEMDDLKNKRFNTSFIREIPKDKTSLKIFTEQEDNDSKWLENVPNIDSDMPDIPGTEFAELFKKIPFNNPIFCGDSDEELKKEKLAESQSQAEKKRKSTRCTEFKGKPIPDQALVVDYTSLLDSESSSDDIPDEVKETEIKKNGQETALRDTVSDNKNSILLSLLSAPVEGPIKPYKYSSLQPSHFYNISSTLEDKMLLNKYKDVLGDKQVNVVLTRLPINAQLLELCEKKKLNLTSAIEKKKRVSKVSKYNVDKKMKLPKVRLSKLQKKNHGNTET